MLQCYSYSVTVTELQLQSYSYPPIYTGSYVKGNMGFKSLVYTGQSDGMELDRLGGAVLGHEVSMEHDTLTVKLTARQCLQEEEKSSH